MPAIVRVEDPFGIYSFPLGLDVRCDPRFSEYVPQLESTATINTRHKAATSSENLTELKSSTNKAVYLIPVCSMSTVDAPVESLFVPPLITHEIRSRLKIISCTMPACETGNESPAGVSFLLQLDISFLLHSTLLIAYYHSCDTYRPSYPRHRR